MSSAKYTFTFSAQAETDLVQALSHSGKKWGREQTQNYREILRKGFNHMAAYPLTGRKCGEKHSDIRMMQAGRHIILYRIKQKEILILRVVHERTHISQQL